MSTTSSRNLTTLYSGAGSVVPQGAYGNANVVSLLDVGTDGGNTVANIVATGNVTAAYFIGDGSQLTNITAGNISGNVNFANTAGTAQYVTANAQANITSVGTLTSVSVTGNVVGGNLITAGAVSATGNVTGGNLLTGGAITATGNVTAANFFGNVFGNIVGNVDAAGSNTEIQFNTGNLLDASANLTFDKSTSTLKILGNTTYPAAGLEIINNTVTGNLLFGNLVITNQFQASSRGPVVIDVTELIVGQDNGGLGTNATVRAIRNQALELTTTNTGAPAVYVGKYVANSATYTGNIDVRSSNVGGYGGTGDINLSGNVYVSRDAQGADATFGKANLIVRDSIFADQGITATGNVTGGNLLTGGSITATGNVTAANFFGNVFGNIVGNVDAAGANTEIQFNTGNLLDASANLTFNTATNVLSVTGNVNGNIINAATFTNPAATGNLFITNQSNAAGNANLFITTTQSNSQIRLEPGTGANGKVVIGGNTNTPADVTLQGAYRKRLIITTNENYGGVLINPSIYLDDPKISPTRPSIEINPTNDGAAVVTGNLFVQRQTGGGGGLIKTEQLSVVGNVGAGQPGNLVALGNITGGNILTGGIISAAGNITAPYFIGNVQGNIVGNVDAAGSNTQVQFNDTGDILGASAGMTFDKTSNALAVTGNVSGGNVTTVGLISATGNVTGGNLRTAGLISATGNINGANLVATANLTSTQQTIVGTANNGSTGNIVMSGKNIATDMAWIPDGGNAVTGAYGRVVVGTGWNGNITHTTTQSRLAVFDSITRAATSTAVRSLDIDTQVSLTGNVTASAFRQHGTGSRIRLGGGPMGNTILVSGPGAGSVGTVSALSLNIDVGNVTPYFLGNTTVSHVSIAGGFITMQPGGFIGNVYGMVPGAIAGGGNITNYTGFTNNLGGAGNVTNNLYAFYHGNNASASTTGISVANVARAATNYYAFRNDDAVAQVQLGSLRSYNEFQYSTATSGTVNIDKTNAQVQKIAPTANVTIGDYQNFMTGISDGTNFDLQSDTVTLIIEQGATPYTVTMPSTANAQIKYAGGSSAVGATANAVTLISISAIRNSGNTGNVYLTAISTEFV